MNAGAGKRTSLAVALALIGGLEIAAAAGAASEWLAVCGKCISPTIFAKSGVGTANARAEARITRAEIEDWCANWQPGDGNCVPQQLKSSDLDKVYRASADCPGGRITPIDGKTYQLAGKWDNSDIGGGRSKWRDGSGRIVGRDNASGGLAISQQWEILCPNTAGRGATASPATPPAGGRTAKSAATAGKRLPAAEYAVGQVVLARYGRDWVRARITGIRHSNGPAGPQVSYDVSLDNGQRGIVPASMLRAK